MKFGWKVVREKRPYIRGRSRLSGGLLCVSCEQMTCEDSLLSETDGTCRGWQSAHDKMVNMGMSVMSASKVHFRRDASVSAECSVPSAAGEWKTRPVAIVMLKCGCLRAKNDGVMIRVYC